MAAIVNIAHGGRPNRPNMINSTPAMRSTRGSWTSWRVRSWPNEPSDAARVTMIPVAVEISSAGIWVTMPSPIVRSVKRDAASGSDIPFWAIPMTRPPMMLMKTMMIAAIASPRTNLDAPSIAP